MPWLVHEPDLPLLVRSKAKQNVFSRAYFHFLTMEAVLNFHQGFDGHLYIDGKGKPFDSRPSAYT